jgi:glycine hydroxymethyltransferase
MRFLPQDDPEVAELVQAEEQRLSRTLNLIAAENHPPASIMEAAGSVLGVKTIEGYPGKRFHAGCEVADRVERLAVDRVKALFGAEHANVQPHSGTSANLAAYFSVLNVGDPVLAMRLTHGGHLSHGHRASITSRIFNFTHYGLHPETETIAYDQVRDLAQKTRPKMIVAGASSYPRLIDYPRLREIADEVGAFLMADVAHIAGLIAAGVIPNPTPFCDFVSLTTYKTFGGPRGGVLLCRQAQAPAVDAAVFPGGQGTSPVNQMAAKAVIFRLAATPAFHEVQQRTLDNAVALADALAGKGWRLVTGGTENHQVVMDLNPRGLSGGAAEKAMEAAGLVANRNAVPADADHPGRVGGLRLGTAALASRGLGPADMAEVAGLIDRALTTPDPAGLAAVREEVEAVCNRFPLTM